VWKIRRFAITARDSSIRPGTTWLNTFHRHISAGLYDVVSMRAAAAFLAAAVVACRTTCPTTREHTVHAVELPAPAPGPESPPLPPSEKEPAKPRKMLLALGAAHTCVSDPDRGVFCWGANARGQVGDGTGKRRHGPARVLADAVDALGAGPEHTCADDHCWGRNDAGQLGDGTRVDRLSPVVTATAPHGDFLGAGEPAWVMNATSSCWAKSQEDGFYVKCTNDHAFATRPCEPQTPCTEWFLEGHGSATTICSRLAGYGGERYATIRCGGGVLDRSAVPSVDTIVANVMPLDGIRSFGVGRDYVCGVQLDGRIVCWGDLSRLLGDGKHGRREIVSGAWSAESIATGDAFACFIRADAALLCFGSEPAMGLKKPRVGLGEPRLVKTSMSAVHAIAAGARHACALVNSGIVCFGKNDESQLGDGGLVDSVEPVMVSTGSS
jgi:hypothetical protein